MSQLPTKRDILRAAQALQRATEAAMMLRDVIDAAIRALDIRAGDPDLEDPELEEGGDSEYSLGAPHPVLPSLSRAVAVLSQEQWSAGAHDADRESEHDGREPEDEI